jgi:hypothetical protein
MRRIGSTVTHPILKEHDQTTNKLNAFSVYNSLSVRLSSSQDETTLFSLSCQAFRGSWTARTTANSSPTCGGQQGRPRAHADTHEEFVLLIVLHIK